MRSWPALKNDSRMWLSRKSGRSFAPPDWLSVNLTLRCNLSCAMCTTCYDAPELSTAELLDLIDQAAAMGIKVFNPLGGEPFVRPDLEQLLAHAVSRGMFVTLTTNGTLIRPERAQKIAAISPENLHINLSIDGPEAVHDHIRGPGTRRRTLEGYRRLRAADAEAGQPARRITVNTVLTRLSAPYFLDFLDELAGLGVDGVQVLNLFRNGTERTADELWFGPADLPALEHLAGALAQRALSVTPPVLRNSADDLRLIPRYYRDELPPLEAPCWAGWKELYINADGEAIMCDGALDFRKGGFGHVRKQTLQELWQAPSLSARREVVKQCKTPCVQACYLRRQSDDIGDIAGDLARRVTRPLLDPVLRRLPQHGLPGLILELSAVPEAPAHPRTRTLFRRSPVDLAGVWAEPSVYERLRDEHHLDTAHGFFGLELLNGLLADLSRGRRSLESLWLGWRGEPLLHPEAGRVLDRLREASARGHIGTIFLWSSGRLLRPGVELRGIQRIDRDTPLPLLPAVSWDGKLTLDPDDHLLGHRVADVLHDPPARWLPMLDPATRKHPSDRLLGG